MTTSAPSRTRRLCSLALLTATALLALGAVVPTAHATARAQAAGPVLTLTPQWAPRLPQAQGEVRFTVATSTTADVTVTASPGAGLDVSPAEPRTIHALTPADPRHDGVLVYEVGSDDPGFHSLTVTASADGADPVSVTLPRIWTPGSTLAGTDSLAGQMYAFQGYVVSGYHGDFRDRATEFLNFFGAHRMTHTAAERGKVACPDAEHASAGDACVPYEHDAATGLTQVYEESIGLFDASTSYLDDDSTYQGRRAYHRVVYPHTGRRLTGAWGYADLRDDPDGVWAEHLRLTRAGRFTLHYRYEQKNVQWHGTYRIRSHGRLVLHHGRGRHRSTTVETLALAATHAGAARPHQGAYLLLEVHPSSGVYYDGNLMHAG